MTKRQLILSTLGLLLTFNLSADPARWAKDMQKFAARDEKNPVAENSLVFVGSSSIRMWDLKKSFPGQPAVNRGFGGSELEDTLHYLDLLVLKHKPAAVFLYAGDNDMAKGKDVARVVSDYQKIAARIRKGLPETHLVFLPIKPSFSRAKLWPEMKKANAEIQALTEKDDKLHYLATDEALLDENDELDRADFKNDGLHLTDAGYAKWNALVLAWLKEQQFAPKAAAEPALAE